MQLACDLVVVAWGDFYLHTLTHLCFPSLLAPDNLPAWQSDRHHRLVIYIPPHETIRVQQYLADTPLALYLDVVFRPVEPFEHSRYETLNRCHQDAIAQLQGTGRSIFFLSPDTLYANGTLAHVQHIAAQGHLGIFNYSPILNAEALLAHLDPFNQDSALCVTPSQMLHLVFAHMHYRTWIYFWMLDAVGKPSACLYWWGEQLIIRAYHWHPLWLARPQPFIHNRSGEAIDGYYLQGYEDMKDTFYLVQDHALMTCSCHPTWLRSLPPLLKDVGVKQRAILDRAAQQFGTIHQWLFEHPISWPATPPASSNLQTLLPQQPPETPAQVEALAQITTLIRLADQTDYFAIWQAWQAFAPHLKMWAAPDLLWLVWGYALLALAQLPDVKQLALEKKKFIAYFKDYPQWLAAIHAK